MVPCVLFHGGRSMGFRTQSITYKSEARFKRAGGPLIQGRRSLIIVASLWTTSYSGAASMTNGSRRERLFIFFLLTQISSSFRRSYDRMTTFWEPPWFTSNALWLKTDWWWNGSFVYSPNQPCLAHVQEQFSTWINLWFDKGSSKKVFRKRELLDPWDFLHCVQKLIIWSALAQEKFDFFCQFCSDFFGKKKFKPDLENF